MYEKRVSVHAQCFSPIRYEINLAYTTALKLRTVINTNFAAV